MTGRYGTALLLAALFGLYVLTGKVGLSVAFVHASATAIWPPTGIALAAFLTLGYECWPAIFAGAFVVNISTAGSVATSLGIATGNTLEGLLGAYLVNRFGTRSEEHTSELQSRLHLVCRLLLEKKKKHAN